MRRITIPLIAVLLPLIAIISIAQSPISKPTSQAEAMRQLKDSNPKVLFYMEGQKVSRVYGYPFAHGETPIDTANDFIAQYGAIFNPGDGEYRLDRTQEVMDGKFTAVYFNQAIGGVPVDHGSVTILVKNESGYPAVLASSNVKDVQQIATTPRITKSQAQNIVRKDSPAYRFLSDPQLVVFKGEVDTHLAWTFTADNLNRVSPKKFEVFVDAESGRILDWRNDVYSTDVTGNTQGFASPGLKPDENINPPVQLILAGLRVAISGGNSAFSDAMGNFVIPNSGNSPVTVTSDMRGQWVQVFAQQGSNLTASQNVTPPGPANFVFNTSPTQFNTSQVNALKSTLEVHNFAKGINSSYPGIDVLFPANVNLASTCNAYFDGGSINFYAAGGGCPNTAYSTVVYHEYGHFIIASGWSGAAGDYHEGMADTTAVLLTNQPGTGEDFFGPNTGPLRSAINNFNYPCNGEVHDCGNVISGAFWLTKEALKATIGDSAALTLTRKFYLNSILLHPSGINPGVTIDVLTLDDDNGNIYDGTPHYTEIEQGFGAKNLHAPALQWVKFTPIKAPGDFFALGATGTNAIFNFKIENLAGTLDPNSVQFHFRYNRGGWLVNPIQGANNLYNFQIPGIDGATMSWYLSAKDTNGHTSYYPVEGQNKPLTTTFGKSLSNVFTDTFESDQGWTVVNENLSTGAWVRADPNGTTLDGRQANPEDDSDDAGAQCMFTGQGAPGGAVGDNDVDGGPTRLLSPTFNMSSGNHIIELKRWFYNSTGEDLMTIEISNDNGATWVPVETVQDTGSSNQWTLIKIPVALYVNPTSQVKLRISTADQPNNSIVEGGIDNVIVKKVNL